MTELEKANKTIEELIEINQELAGVNSGRMKALERIRDLENELHIVYEQNHKYQRKLVNRKEIIKDAMRELLIEILESMEEK
jgi:hypothetical protein